jgi:putative transposase
MGQSLSQLYVHLIFCTKKRKPFLKKEIRGKLNAYFIGTLKAYDCPSIETNCVEDHVHILFRLSKNIALAKVVEEVKKQSSKWLKIIEGGDPNFSWGVGYAAFSVSSSVVEIVKRYVANQEAHHRKKDLKKEIEEFCKKYDVIEYDEKYFWE